MKLCIVGQGPTAEGHGEEIDACDCVVRIKTWWHAGAEDAGSKWDVHAHYGDGFWDERPEFHGEHWFTQPICQVRQNPFGWSRLAHIANHARYEPVRFAPDALWDAAFARIGRHPSTGFVTVAMAMEIVDPAELVLFGFDGTTPDKPRLYNDARGPVDTKCSHDQLAEKRAIAELFDGTWLGKPSRVRLVWPQMPELGGVTVHPRAGSIDRP